MMISIELTLAGGDVNGLLLSSRVTKSVICRSSTGNVAIRLQLKSNETKFKQVTSEIGDRRKDRESGHLKNCFRLNKKNVNKYLWVSRPSDCFVMTVI